MLLQRLRKKKLLIFCIEMCRIHCLLHLRVLLLNESVGAAQGTADFLHGVGAATHGLRIAVLRVRQPALVVGLEHIFMTIIALQDTCITQIRLCLHIETDRAHRRLHIALPVQVLLLRQI